MLDAKSARERAEAMDRRHETLGDRWDATAIDYLRVQAETLEECLLWAYPTIEQMMLDTRAEIARMEAHDAE